MTLLSRRLFGISADTDEGQGRGAHHIYHALRRLLLYCHAFRAEKCKCNVPAYDAELPRSSDREEYSGLLDDIVIMTKEDSTFLDDLRETFDNLDRYRI